MRTKPTGTTDVGRSTVFGNPFHVRDYGSAGATIPHYRRWLWNRVHADPGFADRVKELKNRRLWCPGCGLDSPTCHARQLERMAAYLCRSGGDVDT